MRKYLDNRFHFVFFLVFTIFLLASCNNPGEKEKITSKDKNEDYKEVLSINYHGVNGKSFNYRIRKDNLKACKLKEEKIYKNGDKLTLVCKNAEENINFSKDFPVNGLLNDDINDPTIKKLVDERVEGAESAFIRQDEYGFSIIAFVKDGPGNYKSDIYKDVFEKDGKLVILFSYNPNRTYSDEDLKTLEEPAMVASNIKEADLEDYKKIYVEKGYTRVDLAKK